MNEVDEDVIEPFDTSEDLQVLLEDEQASKQEKSRVSKLLPNEVWQSVCHKCGKLAVRIFPPRKNLNTIFKKDGIKGVMDSCNAHVKNNRVLIDTPSFNLILTGNHREADGYNLANTAYDKCDVAVMITDSPRDLVWHIFTRLRAVRFACLVNGVSYSELRDWFDGLSEDRIKILLPNIITYDTITDPDENLNDGPWQIAWVDTSALFTLAPLLHSKDVNGDSVWDSALDPNVTDQLAVKFIEYGGITGGENCVDVSKNGLTASYYGSTFYTVIVEPAGTPGKFLVVKTSLTKENFHKNPIFQHFVHDVPSKYWSVESSRYRPGIKVPDKKDPNFIYPGEYETD